MSNFISLSHILSENTPAYGNGDKPTFEKINSIKEGASSNKTQINTDSHLGTHVDFPYHFLEEGKKGEEFLPNDFVFTAPFLIELPVHYGLITNRHLSAFTIPIHTDLLLIKTGMEQFRNEKKYWENGPGMASETAFFFKYNFPRLRAIGFDFLSLSSYQHREEGRLAHKNYLSNHILIIEDMKLLPLSKSNTLNKVLVAPLLFANCDGAPVYVLAETE
ncbi:MAG: cyclase [Bacteroidetes bacterium]|nr:cyclase [Bacteroidota bacterium]MBV6462188.1 Kynurenine formamidase [Flavobacteriales bacterium]WKZ75962.1 MAG: cyclase family protein [Vicingaceae bacterium]MCL4816906.1 cyclase family protein [Flavobacteriales bacterium]NOG96153.1 cyclase [Bacteroidota bacterium]